MTKCLIKGRELLFKTVAKRILGIHDDWGSLPVGWRLLRGISWLVIGMVFGRLSIWLCRIVAARTLGAAVLGEFGLIESSVNMFMAYAALGMTVAVSKNLAECFRTDLPRAGRIIGTVCLFSGLFFVFLLIGFFLCSPRLAMSFSDKAEFLTSMRVGILLALMVPGGIAATMINSFQAFHQVAASNTIQGFVSLVMILILPPVWGLNGVIVAFGSGTLVMLIYQVAAIKALCRKFHIHITFSGVRQDFPLLWRYGIPSMLGGLLVGPAEWGARAILVKQGGGTQELGLYVGVLSLCSILIAASALLQNVSIPVLSSSANLLEKQKGILRNIFIYWSVSLCGVIFLVAGANLLIKVLLGPDFSRGAPVLAIAAIAVGIRVFYTSFGVVLIVLDRVWYMTFNNLMDAPIFLSGAVFLAPRWGAEGLALAYLGSSLAVLFLLYRSSAREMAWESPSKIGILLSIMLICAAWLISKIALVWLAVLSTFLLLGITVAILLFLAQKYDLLGAITSKIPRFMNPTLFVTPK
jgi:O-antigen/teichoic acid export membrane protein